MVIAQVGQVSSAQNVYENPDRSKIIRKAQFL